MKVAILGTGPSAAYVGMACDTCNVEYEVISNKSPTTFFPGAFWARSNPLDYAIPAFEVYISSVGSAIEYLKKQWGMVEEDWLLETSFPKGSRKEIVFDPIDLFGVYWKGKDVYLTSNLTDEAIAELANEYDIVFMTFATEKSKKEWSHLLCKFPIVSYPSRSRLSYCIYDGEKGEAIVRMSDLFGYVHNEYISGYIPKMELVGKEGRISWASDLIPGLMQMWDPKDVPADNVVLVGRWAQWSRKILSHDAYGQTIRALEEKCDVIFDGI